MFCDVDGGVINRDSWSRVRGFSLVKSLKVYIYTYVYANGLGG
jgi:hypothetical protein